MESIKKIFFTEPVNSESYYIDFMDKNDEREIQCFDCRLIQTKIFMTEEVLLNSIISRNYDIFDKMLSIIPMDSDILYYYKFIFKWRKVPMNCFLRHPAISGFYSIKFITFIRTHIMSLKDVEILRLVPQNQLKEEDMFKRLMICDDPEEKEYCGALAKILSYKLFEILSDDCSVKHPQVLRGLSCVFKNSFIPIPTTPQQYYRFRELINSPNISKIGAKSTNGSVFQSKITLNDTDTEIVIKIPLELQDRTLYEGVVSMCIVNEYMDRFPAEFRKSYNYCLGLFSCPNFVIKEDEMPVLESKIKEKLCSTNQGIPNIYSVYEKIQGKTLASLMSENLIVDVDKFKFILMKILLQLIPLQEGMYKFTHGDLHANNVMINNWDNNETMEVYIIDYGLASFQIAGMSFHNFLESEFLDDDVFKTKKNIVTGVHDIAKLLNSIEYYCKNGKIKKYCSKIIAHILLKDFSSNGNRQDGLELYKEFSGNIYRFEEFDHTMENLILLEIKTYLWIFNAIMSVNIFSFSCRKDAGDKIKEKFLITETIHEPLNNNNNPEQLRRSKIVLEWTHDVLKNKRFIYAFSFIRNLYDKYAMYDVKWTRTNNQLKILSCMYITYVIFNSNSPPLSMDEWVEMTENAYTVNELEKDISNLLTVLNWDVLPISF